MREFSVVRFIMETFNMKFTFIITKLDNPAYKEIVNINADNIRFANNYLQDRYPLEEGYDHELVCD